MLQRQTVIYERGNVVIVRRRHCGADAAQLLAVNLPEQVEFVATPTCVARQEGDKCFSVIHAR